MNTPAPPGNRVPPKPPPLDLRGLAILSVEDDTDSREMLEQMVGSFGATVLSARNGADAMDRVGEHHDEMWDEQDGFFYDLLRLPDGQGMRLKVRSLVGLLPQIGRAHV